MGAGIGAEQAVANRLAMRQTLTVDLKWLGEMTNNLDPAFARVEQLIEQRALPGVTRSTSYGTPAFKVGGKGFVRLRKPDILVLPCPAGQKALLMEISPDIYFETRHYVGQAAVLVRLSAISDEELALRLEDAWRFRASGTLAAHRPAASPA